MPKQDQIDIVVLDDGTIKSENGKISPQNHHNASEFFKFLAEVTGGSTEAKRRTGHVHVHSHEEQTQ